MKLSLSNVPLFVANVQNEIPKITNSRRSPNLPAVLRVPLEAARPNRKNGPVFRANENFSLVSMWHFLRFDENSVPWARGAFFRVSKNFLFSVVFLQVNENFLS